MPDIFPGTLHRESIAKILRQLIYRYKAADTSTEIYSLDIRLTGFSDDYKFVLPRDREALEKQLSCLEADLVCLSFPKLDSKPYLIRRVEFAGEYFSYIERID